MAAPKSHCGKGHPMSGDNLYISPGRGRRGCRACGRAGEKRRARGEFIPKPTTEERFWAKVDKNGPLPADDTLAAGKGPCWLWTGASNRSGYGTFSLSVAVFIPAHRFAYELLVDPIGEGLELDHLCRIRKCVNPRHLDPVSQRENILRGGGPTAVNAAKTHCIHDHEFTPENTYVYGTRRSCKTCMLATNQRRRALERGSDSTRSLVGALGADLAGTTRASHPSHSAR